MNYHIHPVTGTPAVCRAEKGFCPKGAKEEHFPSREEARAAYEELMKDDLIATHKVDTQTADAVRELFDHHIAKTENLDVKTLLEGTKEELARATSVVTLNRIAALYNSAAGDLEDDRNLTEASQLVSMVAEDLRTLYRGLRHSVTAPEKLTDESYIAPLREKVLKTLGEVRQWNLNKKVLESGESGIIETDGYRVAVVGETEITPSLGELIRNTPSDSFYPGRARIGENSELRSAAEANASLLVKAFSRDGIFHPPERHERARDKLPKCFYFLSGGEESNVYMHEASEPFIRFLTGSPKPEIKHWVS